MARDPLPDDVLLHQPEVSFTLEQDRLLRNLRVSRRGGAAGPSGMNADHLRPLLDSVHDSELFWRFCEGFARATLPDEIVRVVKMGRVTALQKPSGGVRGIVVGDIVRRLVARTISQQITPTVEVATAPFQFALSTRAGTECVAHVLQSMSDVDPLATVVSIDGVGAFDLVSRSSMLRGLLGVEGGGAVLPFVRQFYGGPSSFLWDDASGATHDIAQGEGGEQGDPLMPALCSLGQHGALEAIAGRLLPSERLFAFLDDLYIVCRPERVVDVYNIVDVELWNHAKIQIHQGKTQVWNQSGVEPRGIETLQAAAQLRDPNAVVWRGDTTLPEAEQGMKILWHTFGSPTIRAIFPPRHERSPCSVGEQNSSHP